MKQLKRTMMGSVLAFAGIACAAPAMAADVQAVVQQQLNAYNAHDIRAFMAYENLGNDTWTGHSIHLS